MPPRPGNPCSKVLNKMTLFSKYTRALTFENVFTLLGPCGSTHECALVPTLTLLSLSTHFTTRLMCEHAYINTNPRAAGARIYPPLSVPTLSPGIDVTARLIEWDVSAVPELEGWIRDASVEMRLLLSQVISCL